MCVWGGVYLPASANPPTLSMASSAWSPSTARPLSNSHHLPPTHPPHHHHTDQSGERGGHQSMPAGPIAKQQLLVQVPSLT